MKVRLTLIAVLALALRLWHLGARSVWLDEGVSIGIARMGWADFGRVLWLREANMGLYYLFLRSWAALGDSEFFLRLPSVLFTVAGITIFAIVVARVANRFTALATAFLLTINVLDVRYSREIRSYGLAPMLIAISWWYFERAVRRGRQRDFVLWVVASALAIYAHMFALLVIVAQLSCLFFAKLEPAATKRFVYATLAGLVAILPLIVFTLHTTQNPLSWVPPLNAHAFWLFLQDFSNGTWPLIVIASGLFLVSSALLFRGAADERFGIAFGVLGTLVPVLIAALVSLHQPAFLSRYLIIVLPNFLMAVALPLQYVPQKASVLVLAGMLLLSVPLLRKFYSEPAWHDFRAASTFVAEHSQPGDVIVIWEPLGRPSFEYYARRLRITSPSVVFPGPPGALKPRDLVAYPTPLQLDDIASRHARIWVLFDTDVPPERYTIWQTLIVRRMSMNHKLTARYVIPGLGGAQVLEFVPD